VTTAYGTLGGEAHHVLKTGKKRQKRDRVEKRGLTYSGKKEKRLKERG
jgi:hypothetical protein